MNNILLIDTATNCASVSLYISESEQLHSEAWESRYNHGSELAPRVAQLLNETDSTLQDLSFAAVVVGPGKFSAVRTGIAYALGLRIALPELKLIGIRTEEAEIAPYLSQVSSARPIYVTIPAGMRELIWYRYEQTAAPAEHGLDKVADFAERIGTSAAVCGEGTALLSEHVSPEAFLSAPGSGRAPLVLLQIARERIRMGQIDSVPVQPIYGREPTITPPKRTA